MNDMPQKLKNGLIHVLLWIQAYTKTDMVYLASGGFWLTLGQAISSLAALALAIAFANLAPPETYGTYKYILSIAGIFAIFSLPGMGTALARTVAKGQEGVMHATTRSRVLHSLVGSVIALGGSGYYLLNGNIELSLAFLIIATTLPFVDTFTGYVVYFTGKRRFDLQTTYHFIAQLATIPPLIVTICFTNNLALILLAYFLPLIVIRTILYWHVARTIPAQATTEEEKEVCAYGKHLTAMQILGTVAMQIDKILIWKFFGPIQVAIYTFALAIPEQTKGPLKGLGELAFPKFAAQTIEQIRGNMPSLWRKIGLYALALLGISLIYILAAPFIFQLFFPQYMESVLYSQIFALSIITNVASIPIAVLSSQKRTSAQYVIAISQPVVAIALLVCLVPLYGIIGAITALILSKYVSTTIALGSLFTLK